MMAASLHPHKLVQKDASGWICDSCNVADPPGTRYGCSEGCDFDLCARCSGNSALPAMYQEHAEKFALFDQQYRNPPACPSCQSTKVSESIMGRPSSALIDYIAYRKERDGWAPIRLAGCCPTEDAQSHKCASCGHSFSPP
eukprot:NODE_6716_length_543_cov_14.325911_g6294_i0.p1 GENE.NODE_6716_length_543_cov_14.325911_g6294_i0~~NODE_6716_length_543_cov_14.325911_g6294_i0.p1  ORF type:complete len:141 (+),score=9.78 NODE_6716_length_543_cov_14.325911_g6294_i0:63-485(+)